MSADWSQLDIGTRRLILVGPSRKNPLPRGDGIEKVPQIAIDGGIKFAVNPILWAGDGDSGHIPTDIPAFHKPTQDMTDLRFCLDGIRNWPWEGLYLFGFLGGRRDHELANFGEIHAEMKRRPHFHKAIFMGENDVWQVLFLNAGEHEMEIHGLFSVFALEPAEVTITGSCRYPAQKLPLQPLSGHGLSNEGTGMVKITASSPFMLIR